MKAREFVLLAVLLIMSGASAALAAEAEPAAGPADARTELSAWFDSLDSESPLLGEISSSPELRQQIDRRLAAMDDAQLAGIRKAMQEVPDWQNAPQMLAGMLPAELRDHLLQTGDYYVSQSGEALSARDELATLVALTRILPDDQLARLGIDIDAVAELEKALDSMSPLEVTILHEKLSATPEWTVGRARALEALPDSVRRGSAALALHGELGPADIESLDAFRSTLLDLLERIDALAPTLRDRLDIGTVRELSEQLDFAAPETLFMIRHQIPIEQLQMIERSVELLERMTRMTDEESADLERFREELESVLADRAHGTVGSQLSELEPEKLLLVREILGTDPNWKSALPFVADAFSDPATEAAILNAGSRAVELEQFRTSALVFIDSSITASAIDPEQGARSAAILKTASLESLALIQAAHSRMPANASAAAIVALPTVTTNAVNVNCVVGLGSISVAGASISLGSINFNWICDPLENAINAVTNTVNSLVSAISSTVTDISNFIRTIPGLAVDALEAFFNDLLDVKINGVSLLGLVNGGNIKTSLNDMVSLTGLNGSGWLTGLNSSLGTMPMLPCPARGTITPFGVVGEDGAYANHQRYQFIVEEILDIIPETEISLAVKIPAQVLFMGFKYLGLCLEEGEDAATWDHYEAYWNTAHTNQQAISTQITFTGNALSAQMHAMQGEMGSRFDQQGSSMDEHFQNMRNLELRLAIEENLLAGEGNELAMFQMPSPYGYLEVAQDILRSSIDGMLAIGEKIGQAEKLFAEGQSAMNAGEFKLAYKAFQKSYAALVK